MANILSTSKRVAVVAALSEGNFIRSTVRLTGVAKNTVTKLLVDLGEACSRFQDAMLVNLPIQRLQVDEIWSFCQMKQTTANLQGRDDEWGIGHVQTFTAIDPETRLVPAWMVGCRDSDFVAEFLADVQSRIVSRIQLTTAGHRMYFEAVEAVFEGDVDYAQVKKTFGKSTLNKDEFERRYSPTKVKAIDVQVIEGFPDPEHISTSINERNNLRHSHELEQVHSVGQCILEEDREPCSRCLTSFHGAQLRPPTWDVDEEGRWSEDYSGDGDWRCGEAVDL